MPSDVSHIHTHTFVFVHAMEYASRNYKAVTSSVSTKCYINIDLLAGNMFDNCVINQKVNTLPNYCRIKANEAGFSLKLNASKG